MSSLALIFFLLTLLSLWLIYSYLIQLKRTEKKLRESEKFLKTIIDAEPECIKLIAADGTLLMMNHAGLAMLEADSLDQVKGHCVYNVVVPEYRGAFVSLTEDVFKGKSGILEFEAVGLKGKHIWLETNAVPLHNDNAEIIASLSITRNITERKKAADALRAAHEELEQKVEERTLKLGLANRALQETKQELLEAQRIAHLGHWDLDLQTGMGKWSDESYRIFGFEPGAFEPTFNKFINSVHPEDRKTVQAYFPDLLLGKHSHVELDLRIIRPSGEERIINTKVEVIADKNGKPFKLNGITLDITERKRAEEERERLIKELQDAISQVKTLSGMLPICSSCKKIRDDKGYWTQIESYISTHSEAEFSHSVCPDCVKKLYPEFCDKIIDNKEQEGTQIKKDWGQP